MQNSPKSQVPAPKSCQSTQVVIQPTNPKEGSNPEIIPEFDKAHLKQPFEFWIAWILQASLLQSFCAGPHRHSSLYYLTFLLLPSLSQIDEESLFIAFIIALLPTLKAP